jgi:hypothetical protein
MDTQHESLSAGDYYEQIGESGALLLGKALQKVLFVLECDSAELAHHDFPVRWYSVSVRLGIPVGSIGPTRSRRLERSSAAIRRSQR